MTGSRAGDGTAETGTTEEYGMWDETGESGGQGADGSEERTFAALPPAHGRGFATAGGDSRGCGRWRRRHWTSGS